jgi:2-hydroxy-6-oxo-6-(2'-aminophenyl)hexa-2,4-dienoate hydrolase
MSAKTIAGAQSKFVDARGIRTHYYEAGKGKPLVLLHGGGAGADSYGNWRGCLRAFAEHFHTFAVDMVGFGNTQKPDPASYTYTQAGRVEHIIATIEALGLRDVNLIGNSMGGITSMGVSIERPDLVNSLILMGSAGVRAPISDELKSIMNYDYTPEGMRKIVRGLTNPDFRVDEDMVSYRHALSVEPGTRAAYGAIMGWLREQGGLYYPEDYMRRVSKKTLVVNGKLDLVVPISCAYRLLELIEHSWGYIIPHCGHWAMIEQPEDFARATLGFLTAQ